MIQKSTQQIERQIKAVEFALRRLVEQNAPTHKIYALNGKLKNLRLDLQEANKLEWLGK